MNADRSHQATRLDALTGRYDPWLLAMALVLAGYAVLMLMVAAAVRGMH